LEEQLNELSARSITRDELVNSQTQIQEIENKMKMNMDENKEEIQISMREMQNSMSFMIFEALDGRLPKGDIKMQGTHENKVSIHVEQTVNNKQFLTSESNSNSGVNYGGGPKFNFPNIELNNFDGTKVFT
jgi:hypothetical protein